MLVKKQYIVFTHTGLQLLYYTEDERYFLDEDGVLVFIPDFEAERLIGLFLKPEQHK